MTDNEIIKALECCTDESYENCNECPYSIDTVSCERMKLLEDSLDLINRQKAEIEGLKEDRNNYQNLYCLTVEDLDTAKLEAIKEFAEKLKNAWSDNRYDSPDIDFDYFVDLVQEMVGENNGDL